jgi:hypothetical protein
MYSKPTLLEIDPFEDKQAKMRAEMLANEARKIEEKKILEAQLAEKKRNEEEEAKKRK